MKFTGKIDIELDEPSKAVLDSPTAEVVAVYAEVLFVDKKGKKYSRMYKVETDLKQIKTDIKKHELFKQFS